MVTSSQGCGANQWIPIVNKITFKIEFTTCKLYVIIKDSIQGSVRLEWTVADFFSNGGDTAFADKMASALGIHPSRIKVVGIAAGSVVVNYIIESNPNSSSSSSTNDIQSVFATLMTSYGAGTLNLGAPILSMTAIVALAVVPGISATGSGNGPNMIVYVFFILSLCVAIITITIITCKILKKKKNSL